MDYLEILSLLLANAALILWMRSETRQDWRHMDEKTDAIQKEMKEFHGRLLVLEERYLNWLMRDK